MEPEDDGLDIAGLRDMLQPLVGEPLTGFRRAVGQVFDFGVQRPTTNHRGEPITLGGFLLKFIYADWRIIQEGVIILGSSDEGDKEPFYGAESPPDHPDHREPWRLARAFLEAVQAGSFMVETVDVGPLGDVRLGLSGGLQIESFAGSAQVHHDQWHFMNLRADSSCLVGPHGQNLGLRKIET